MSQGNLQNSNFSSFFEGSVNNSWSNDNEPKSLPCLANNNNLYHFEIGVQSVGSRNSLPRTNSTLTLGSTPKEFQWGISNQSISGSDCWYWMKSAKQSSHCSPNGSSSNLNTPQNGSMSSVCSSSSYHGNQRCLDWGKLVDNVFREEGCKSQAWNESNRT